MTFVEEVSVCDDSSLVDNVKHLKDSASTREAERELFLQLRNYDFERNCIGLCHVSEDLF